MEHIEDDAGRNGPRGVALMWRDMEHLPRLHDMQDAGYRQLERAAQKQRPLLVGMGVIGDHGAGSNVDPALSNVVRMEVTAEIAGSDLTRSDGGELE